MEYMQVGCHVELTLLERQFDGSERCISVIAYNRAKTHIQFVPADTYYLLTRELIRGYLVVGHVIGSSNCDGSLEAVIQWRAYDLKVLTKA